MGMMAKEDKPIDADELSRVELLPDATERLERAVKRVFRQQNAPAGKPPRTTPAKPKRSTRRPLAGAAATERYFLYARQQYKMTSFVPGVIA